MRAVIVISLLVAVVAASKWGNSNYNYSKNYRNLTERDGKHQKFILDLLRHLQQDVYNKEFIQYSQTIRLDNKSDYKNLDKVYYLVSLYQNGWFVQRNQPFSLLRERNIITTKALFDFFDTMNDWNTVAMNLIWARRNINEYQFWHLINLLVTHNRHFNNIVLPAGYEVFPYQFFTGDVMDQGFYTYFTYGLNGNNDIFVMSNYTTGVSGSNDNDDNNNVYDLNDVKNGNNKITDWNTLKKVMYDIKNQFGKNSRFYTNGKNKDFKNKVWNNNRNLNQGNKFDNNGEDRLVYFTEDIGLNNYYYFSKVGNSRIVDNKQMYNNINNRENFNSKTSKNFNNNEVDDKINRRGERYLYQMEQLLARFNLERKSNGLDNVQDLTLDGTVDNGVYPNLRYTNGLQMPNRQNGFNLQKQHNMKLIQVTRDFENRFYRAIDQGFVLNEDGHKVSLQSKNGINILGNLLQGNRDSVNTQYYRYLEYYYRLLFGGNNNDNIDFNDNRFVPTVLDHYETSMRDSVFWQIIKRITNIVNKFQDKLTGYKTQEVDFNGVKINNVKVDKLFTTFNYFDADIGNGIYKFQNFGNKNSFNGNSGESNSDESKSDSDSSSSEESNEFQGNNFVNKRNYQSYNFGNGKSINNGKGFYNKYDRNVRSANNKKYYNGKYYSEDSKSDSNDSDDSNSSSNESNDSNSYEMNYNENYINRNGKYGNKKNFDKNYKSSDRYNYEHGSKNFDKNYKNGDRYNYEDGFKNYNQNNKFFGQGNSRQVDYWNRNGGNDRDVNIFARTRRLDTKRFTVTLDVQSNKNQFGIVRIFLGSRINNKQQLNDNRQNFVELDQFIVKLNQGNNLIKRNSVDFKNVVGDPETMGSLYYRTINFLNKKNNGKDIYTFNYDTINNNRGFPHRLVLPKGTVGGEDFTMFFVVSSLDDNNFNHVQYNDDNMNTLGNTFSENKDNSYESKDSSDSNDSSSSSDESNDSNSNEMNYKQNKYGNYKNGNDYNKFRYGNNFNSGKYNSENYKNGNKDYSYGKNSNGNWGKTNGVLIHNFNNGNKYIGNGNGVLDNRAMGFPLDRHIYDVTGFITNNMFFKDVTIFHDDSNTHNFKNFNSNENY